MVILGARDEELKPGNRGGLRGLGKGNPGSRSRKIKTKDGRLAGGARNGLITL